MSNMYNILKKLDSISQEPSATEPQATTTRALQESINKIQQTRNSKNIAESKASDMEEDLLLKKGKKDKKDKVDEAWEDMEKYLQDKEKNKGTGKFEKTKTDRGTKYTKKFDDNEDDDGEAQDETSDEKKNKKKKAGRPEGAKSGAKHSYKKVDEQTRTIDKIISEAYGDFFEDDLEEDDMEEGNEFSGELKKARDAGEKEFEVDGKKYKVREDKDKDKDEDKDKDGKCEDCGCVKSKCICDDEEDKPVNESISVLKKLAGFDVNKKQLNECGMSAPMGISSENREGRMNISTNMSSDGNKNVTITADGDAANDLMQMLKLAGMDGLNQASDAPTLAVAGMPAMHSVPSIAVGHDHGGVDSMSDLMRLIDGGDDSEEEHVEHDHESGAEEVYTAATADDSEEHDDDKEMEEEHVPGHLADNKPRTQQMSVQKQIRGGDGDVAGQQKHMYKSGSARFSDNPMAVSENSFSGRLLKEYESIKIKSNKK
jgi:hypothetical protein